MFEWTISLGAAITIGIAFVGFGATLVYNAISVGRYAGSTDERLKDLGDRMTALELAEKKMTDILVEIARSKNELTLLSKRIDDLQMHGSYKLAETLENLRRQTLADLKDLIRYEAASHGRNPGH